MGWSRAEQRLAPKRTGLERLPSKEKLKSLGVFSFREEVNKKGNDPGIQFNELHRGGK